MPVFVDPCLKIESGSSWSILQPPQCISIQCNGVGNAVMPSVVGKGHAASENIDPYLVIGLKSFACRSDTRDIHKSLSLHRGSKYCFDIGKHDDIVQ